MTASGIEILAQVLSERFVNTAAVGLLLAGLVWMLLRLVGRANSGTRFAVWFSALLATVALPFLSGSTFAHSLFHSALANAHGGIILSSDWAFYLFAGWIAGASLLLLRLAGGLWRVRAVRGNCTEVDLAGLDPAISEIFRTLPSRRHVTLCTSNDLAVPAAIGLFRPLIVIPAWLLPQLSTDELEMIVRHELAHLCRWDDWTNLIQKVVKAIFFFHPAVWWIENHLTLEREMACDDLVLAQTESPRAYASSLISFAEKLQNARALALAQAFVSRMHQMSLRVAQILDSKRSNRTGIWKPAVGLSVGLLAMVLGVAPSVPRLVAFRPQASPRHSQPLASAILNAPVADTVVSHSTAGPVGLRRNFVSQRAIPATFHPRTALAQTQLRTKAPQTPLIMRTSDVQEQPAVRQTIFILRSAQYDASSPSAPAVWTLCIFTLGENGTDGRQVESAIVVSWI